MIDSAWVPRARITPVGFLRALQGIYRHRHLLSAGTAWIADAAPGCGKHANLAILPSPITIAVSSI